MNPPVQPGPLVSVIIPVKNGGGTIDACLRSIRRSYYDRYEIIVVDDHSTDNSCEIASAYPCTVLHVADGTGANAARNFGAAHAKGEILLFIDSDIVISRETILDITETLGEGAVDAVVGIYTAKHRHESFVSQYKNLWVRYSYMKSSPAIDWLFGAISGIQRAAFERLGGFNADLLARHGNDDVELGKRFAEAHLTITLNMDIEVEHLKQYTVSSFVKNEFHRSAGFARLAKRLGEVAMSFGRGFVNVPATFIISTLLTLVLLIIGAADIAGLAPRWLTIGLISLYFILNIRFLNYLEQVRGLFAMIVMIPIMVLDHLICLFGATIGVMQSLARRQIRE